MGVPVNDRRVCPSVLPPPLANPIQSNPMKVESVRVDVVQVLPCRAESEIKGDGVLVNERGRAVMS